MLLAAACGQVDRIDQDVAISRLGDGEHYTQNIVVPLSDKQIAAFSSPIAGFDPLVRGFMGTMMGLGASIGAGKTRLTLEQPLPEIPEDYVASIKVKRIFFYMEADETVEPSLFNLFGTKKKENFDFLRRLAVKISPTNMAEEDHSQWVPKVGTGDISEEEMGFFQNLFSKKKKKKKKELEGQQKWVDEADAPVMFAYHQEATEATLQGNEVGSIIIIKTEKPSLTRKYLETDYKQFVKRVHTLNKSILVELHNNTELNKNKVTEAKFEAKLANDSLKIEELEIGEITECSVEHCLDFKVKDINLIPIMKKGNGLKIDAYIDPKDVPKSFQLKGFLEFEVKIKTKI